MTIFAFAPLLLIDIVIIRVLFPLVLGNLINAFAAWPLEVAVGLWRRLNVWLRSVVLRRRCPSGQRCRDWNRRAHPVVCNTDPAIGTVAVWPGSFGHARGDAAWTVTATESHRMRMGVLRETIGVGCGAHTGVSRRCVAWHDVDAGSGNVVAVRTRCGMHVRSGMLRGLSGHGHGWMAVVKRSTVCVGHSVFVNVNGVAWFESVALRK